MKMIRNLLIVALATLALGAPKVHRQSLSGRIIGGDDVEITEHPHQISLEWNHRGYTESICGGSIIHEKFVVTGSHCTEGFEPNELTIRAGTSILQMNGTVVQVKGININPDFDPETHDYDISILELEEPLEWSDSIKPIALPETDSTIAEGTVVNVTGWGVMKEGDWQLSPQLQVMQVKIVSNAECGEIYGDGRITDRMLCAGVPEGGKDACSGDAGSPLSADGVLLGTVSWGHGCAQPGYPGVYGNVAALRNYIDEVIKS